MRIGEVQFRFVWGRAAVESIKSGSQWVQVVRTGNRGDLYMLLHTYVCWFCAMHFANKMYLRVESQLQFVSFRIFPNGIAANCVEVLMVGIPFVHFQYSLSVLMMEISKDATGQSSLCLVYVPTRRRVINIFRSCSK